MLFFLGMVLREREAAQVGEHRAHRVLVGRGPVFARHGQRVAAWITAAIERCSSRMTAIARSGAGGSPAAATSTGRPAFITTDSVSEAKAMPSLPPCPCEAM